METCDFQDVLDNAAGFCGLDRENLAADEFADLRGAAHNRLRYAWNMRDWSALKRTQKRYFRADYASGTTYGAPTASASNEVFDPATQEYYQNLRSTTGNAPTIAGVENSAYWAICEDSYSGPDWLASQAYTVGTIVRNPANARYYQCHTAHTSGSSLDATKFGFLTEFDRYVAYEQSGLTALGDVLGVTDLNPKTRGDARPIDHFTSENGLQILEDLAYVWIEFRMRTPNLTGIAWDNAKIYTSGKQVYYENRATSFPGNFYSASATTAAAESPESTPTKWTVLEIPNFLRSYLENGLAADWLTADDRFQPAAKYEALAGEFLAAEALRHDEQNDSQRLELRTR